MVYGGHDLIAENGTILAESRRFENGAVYGIMDIHKLNNERRRMTTCGFASDREREGFREALFYLEKTETKLEQKFDSRPFVPSSETERARRCEEILNIQATGLKKTSGSYSLPECCDRTFRRSGFHTCPSCNSQGF